jgi:hypothetical protein
MRNFLLALVLTMSVVFIACESEEEETETIEAEENDTMRQRILDEANETLDTTGTDTTNQGY